MYRLPPDIVSEPLTDDAFIPARRDATWLPSTLLGSTLLLALLVPMSIFLSFNRVLPADLPAFERDDLQSRVETCEIDGTRLFVRGWAFVPGESGVRRIDVYLSSGSGSVVKLPSRVERREDVALASTRPSAHDTLYDGFSAASARLDATMLATPVSITLVRQGNDGRLHGSTHACR